MLSRAKSALAVTLLATFSAAPARAQPGPVDLPVARQVVMMVRVLGYNRALAGRGGTTARVWVLFKSGHAASAGCAEAMLRGLMSVFADATLAGSSVQTASVDHPGTEGLAAKVEGSEVVALYVCPGLEAEVPSIAGVTRRKSILTFTGRESMVKAGLSVGLLQRGPRPTVLVNLAAARAEGADLDARFLRIAEVM